MSAHMYIRRGTSLAAMMIAVGSLAAKRHQRDTDAPDGEQTVARCSAHHLFTTTWAREGVFTVGRYGPMRFQRCPVTRHWSLVTPADPADLTEEQRQAAAAFHDERVS